MAIVALVSFTATSCGNETATPETLLGKLPASSYEYMLADVQALWGRPGLQSEVDASFGNLINATGRVVDEDTLRSANISLGVFGFPQSGDFNNAVGVLAGDFENLAATLEQAANYETTDELEAELIGAHRGIEILVLSRRPPDPITVYLAPLNHLNLALAHNPESVKSKIDQFLDSGELPTPYYFGGLQQLVERGRGPTISETYRGVSIYEFPDYDPVYLAVPDQDTLFMGFSPQLIKEMIDRAQDGGEPPKLLSEILSSLPPAAFLHVLPLNDLPASDAEHPFGRVKVLSRAVYLGQESASTVRFHLLYQDESEAAAAAAWLNAQPGTGGLLGGQKPSSLARHIGRAVLTETIVDDRDLGGFIFGN